MVQFTASVAAIAAVLLPQVAAQSTCAGVTARYAPKMGAGYRFSALATGLRQPRHIALDTAGNLLVVEQTGGAVKRLVLKEQGDVVCLESSKDLVTGGASNHGIALSSDGKTLFLSNLNSVTAYAYDAAAGTVGTGKVIITGMQNSGTHPTRTVLTSKINPDIIMVARGSNGNVDTATTDKSSGRSMIKTFSLKATSQTAAQYNTGGDVLGWGLRNIVGMGEDPVFGGVWSVENSMDDVKLSSRDIHTDNPAEKFNFHGNLNDTNNKQKGANFGYPSCVAAWDTGSVGGSAAVGSLFSPDGVPRATDCASRTPARLFFHPHTAPLDVKFLHDGSAAFVTFHGSWNRQPPDGYRLMRVDFKNGQPVADATSKTAAIPVMENQATARCPGSCFRPVGLAIDAKGRIFMSSDSSGEIFVIYKT